MARLETLLEPLITDLGYEIVRVRFSADGGRSRLQVMVEPQGGGSMALDSCALLSREISALLDVEDPIEERFHLEVSSPGTDRPLTRLKDFALYVGYDAKFETLEPIQGQKRYRGELAGVDGQTIRYLSDKGPATLDYSNLAKAKLVLNDKLTQAVLKGHFPPKPQILET